MNKDKIIEDLKQFVGEAEVVEATNKLEQKYSKDYKNSFDYQFKKELATLEKSENVQQHVHTRSLELKKEINKLVEERETSTDNAKINSKIDINNMVCVFYSDLSSEFAADGSSREEIKDLLDTWGVKNYSIDDTLDGKGGLHVDVDGDVDLSQAFVVKKGRRFPFKWGVIKGNFNAGFCILATLLNSPDIVMGDFNVVSNSIKDLSFSPKHVEGNFLAANNKGLLNLRGNLETVGGDFDISNCDLLSLKFSPKSVGGSFKCSNNLLKTLGGLSPKIGGAVEASNNALISLQSTEGCEIGGEVHFSNNPISPDDEMDRARW